MTNASTTGVAAGVDGRLVETDLGEEADGQVATLPPAGLDTPTAVTA